MVTLENIKKIKITETHREAAKEIAEKKAFKHSMRGSEANLIGTLGEIITYQYLNQLKIKTEFDLQFNHDLILLNNLTADVKTKERTVPPQLHYDCTVPEYNHHLQRPNIFIFVSLHATKNNKSFDRFHTGYILGYISLKKLEKIAKHWTPEMIDISNKWTPTIPCYNVRIDQLNPIQM